MEWVLVIYFGISSWGAGGVSKVEYKDEPSCYKALKEMRIEVSGDDDEQVIAYCRPKQEG